MSETDERNRHRPSSRGGKWTAVFEKDGAILRECGPDAFSGRGVVVGRGRECDWSTADIDQTLSSRHAELRLRRGALLIRDLGSRNGLFFRGERVKEHRFSPGDSVLLGSCKITVEPVRNDERDDAPAFHRIERLNGSDAGTILEIHDDAGQGIEIGSDPECAVFCPDTLVSRRHARLVVKKDGGCWIRDEGSRNGTTVNGVPLKKDKERMLRDRDVIGIAQLEFRFLEKGAIHSEVRLGRMLLVAVATVALAVMAFSLWNLSRTGAPAILARAESTARATWKSTMTNDADFAEAFALLDAAEQSRNGSDYAKEIRQMRNKFSAWTNAIGSWRAVRADLPRGKWKTARKRFPVEPECLWNFNASEAPAAKRRAGEVQRLLDAFLEVREEAFGTTTWDDDIPKAVAKFSGSIDRLSEALSPFLPPAGSSETWAKALVSESTNIVAELRIETNELAKITKALSSLSWTDSSEPSNNAASIALSTIEVVQTENADRGNRQRTATVSFGSGKPDVRPVPFFSTAVFHCAAGARRPLPKLVEAEQVVAENIRRIARQDWDEVETTLPLPPETMTVSREEFKSFREWLKAKNDRLCGPVREEWHSRTEALRNKGFSESDGSRMSAAFANLLTVTNASDVLEFLPLSSPMPEFSSTNGIATFDRLFGAIRTRQALTRLVDGCVLGDKSGVRNVQGLRTFYAGNRRDLFPSWRPVVVEVLDELDSLRGMVGLSENGLFTLVYNADVPDEENLCRKWVDSANRHIVEVRNWTAKFLTCTRTETNRDRDRILGEFAMLLLAPDLALDGVEAYAVPLAERFDRLEKEIDKIDEEIRDGKRDGLVGSREIVEKAIPSDKQAYVDARERVLLEERRNGGGK